MILDGYECKNRSFKADGLRQHVSQIHSNSWCGMGVELFLHELYPSPLTANKESTANQNKRGNKRKKGIHPPTSVPFSSVLNDRYKRSRGPLLMAKSHLATSQGDNSTSEPDNKSKDGSIDPPQNQGDETDPKENPDDNSQSDHSSDQGSETNSKSFAQPTCSWSISSKGCQLPGVEPKDECGVNGCQSMFHHLCQTEWEIYQYHLD